MRKIEIFDLIGWGRNDLNKILEEYPKTKVTYRVAGNRVWAIADYRTEQQVKKPSKN